MPHLLQGRHRVDRVDTWKYTSVLSQVHWNTPLRMKMNFNSSFVDATLDTGASLSAVQADLIQVNDSYPKNAS